MKDELIERLNRVAYHNNDPYDGQTIALAIAEITRMRAIEAEAIGIGNALLDADDKMMDADEIDEIDEAERELEAVEEDARGFLTDLAEDAEAALAAAALAKGEG